MNLHRMIQRIALGSAMIAGCYANAFCQLDRANTGSLSVGATANYRFAESSELAMTVTLLGSVERPGRYELSAKVDLVNLLALAGGWTENADMSDVRITRERTPNDPGNRFQVLLNLENLTDISPKFLELQDGDCVFVGKSSPVTVPLVLSIVSSAATVAIAIAYFTVVNQR